MVDLLTLNLPSCPITHPPYLVSPPDLPSVSYVPNVITPEQAAYILSFIDAPPPGEATTPWVELRARRLQQHGGQPLPSGLANKTPLPPYLQALSEGLVAAGIFPPSHPPNHVLINDYALGEGIVSHTDGPRYFPTVATLSLLDASVMRFSVLHGKAKGGQVGGEALGDLLLQGNSLVVTAGLCYSDCAHAISEQVDTTLKKVWNSEVVGGLQEGEVHTREGRRVSVTIRHAFEGAGGEKGGEEGGVPPPPQD